jgi:two-component system, LytTR family, sensor kinase
MLDQSKGVIAALTGTHSNKKVTVLLHVIFWIIAYFWLEFQSRWLSGDGHPEVTTLITLTKFVVVLTTFYLISHFVDKENSRTTIWLYILIILAGAILSYNLVVYYAYNYINGAVPTMPPYFKRLVQNISSRGPWTFLQNSTVFYFLFEQFVLAMFIPLLIKAFRAFFQSRIRSMALEKDNLKLELDFLRNQINPHFLFNTLNSVYSLIEEKDQTAASIVFSLSNMMRYALYDSNTTETDVEKELTFIRNYIEIQTVRHSRRLEIELDISHQIGFQRIPPLLLINFIENAIKHGADKLIKKAWIHIKAYRDQEGAFCFSVVNSKPPSIEKESAEGIGIRNTRRRLNILYPKTHSLDIVQSETEYNVLLRVW